MGNSRLPGPICSKLKDWGWIDEGTTCRASSPTPGPTGDWRERARQNSVQTKKEEYLSHARQVSYAMQGKVLAEKGWNAVDELLDSFGEEDDKPSKSKPRPPRIQSYLGGAFLRMYLDGTVDPEIVEEAGVEIGESPRFARLTTAVTKRVQRKVDRRPHHKPTEKEVAERAKKYLTWLRSKRGIAFKRTLNPVIGGVSGVDVTRAVFVKEEETPRGMRVEYEIHVVFRDTYDFENERHGVYDRYRKELAAHLQKDEFWEFDKKYFGAVAGIDAYEQPKLDNAALFASFMYALEQRGWTPGPLAWEVTVPMKGSFVYKKSGSRGASRRRGRSR